MRKSLLMLIVAMLLFLVIPADAQGGPGTKDFPIRDFNACINLPDFAAANTPDAFNTVYDVPGLFSINFAEYLLPLEILPATGDDIYSAMINLLNTVNASAYMRVDFNHPEYVSAAVEFTLDGKRMFGMIYRNQDDKLFFLFADKVDGFDMLAIGRAIFAADGRCNPVTVPAATEETTATEVYGIIRQNTTWRGEVHVIGDLQVENNVTLTIEPGTIVRVAAHQDVNNLSTWPVHQLQGFNPGPEGVDGVEIGEPFWDEPHHVSIRIFGMLQAVGTPEERIVITSDSANPQPSDWNIFEIHNGTLSYAVVEYHRILQGFDDVLISHNIIRYSGEQGAGAGENASPIIEHNDISFSGHELIYINGGAPIIRNNTLGPNPIYGAGNPSPGIGIAIAKGAPQIINNAITGCSQGILFAVPPEPGLVLEGNTFQDNAIDIEHRY